MVTRLVGTASAIGGSSGVPGTTSSVPRIEHGVAITIGEASDSSAESPPPPGLLRGGVIIAPTAV